jgi:hypothetical protein
LILTFLGFVQQPGAPPHGHRPAAQQSHVARLPAMLRCTMADSDRTGGLDQLARDWITLWESELAALAHDREGAETLTRLAAIWAGSAAAWLRAAPAAQPHESQAARPDAAAGTPPAAAAPDAGEPALRDLLGSLADRLGAIETRLAALERRSVPPARGRAGGKPGGRAKPQR